MLEVKLQAQYRDKKSLSCKQSQILIFVDKKFEVKKLSFLFHKMIRAKQYKLIQGFYEYKKQHLIETHFQYHTHVNNNKTWVLFM